MIHVHIYISMTVTEIRERNIVLMTNKITTICQMFFWFWSNTSSPYPHPTPSPSPSPPFPLLPLPLLFSHFPLLLN